jgi:hypothetical protein
MGQVYIMGGTGIYCGWDRYILWAGQVYIVELRNAYQIFVETRQWKGPLEI